MSSKGKRNGEGARIDTPALTVYKVVDENRDRQSHRPTAYQTIKKVNKW